jgi:hypothetical protein
MAFTTAGLANGGVTTHYRFQYDDSLQQWPTNPNEPEPVRTNLFIVACDRFMSLFKVTCRAETARPGLPPRPPGEY